MYPDLSYLLHDLFGTQPDNWTSIFKTFGLLLVISILVAAWILFKELLRKKEEGIFQGEKQKTVEGAPATWQELVSNGLFGFILGFKLVYLFQNFAEFQRDAADVLLSAKGNWPAGLVFGAIFAGLRYWEKNKAKLPKPVEKTVMLYPHDRIGDITIWAAVSGIIGAKFFSILEDLPSFLLDPVGMFFSGSGLAIYGGLIGGFLGVGWYLRRHKIPFWHVADAVAPALMIGYGIGRLGCHFSGDGDWGIAAAAIPEWWFLPDWLWAYDYPNNVAQDGVLIEGCEFQYCMRLDPPVYPTPLYETFFALIIAGILWLLRRRMPAAGMLFFLYLIFNGVERFFIEKIRVNIRYEMFGFQPTQAEVISVLFFLIGAIGMFALWRKKK
jgi:phosphatidylglycerol---prolipoprotein diacylglyceryl transferase